MRVLVVGEGASELNGALQSLVGRLSLRRDLEIEHDRVSCPDIHVHHGKGKGYFKRAVRWLLEAEKRGFVALVLVVDRDDDPDRVRELVEAQQYAKSEVRRAFGVAIRTFDAWMLADEVALTQVLGYQVNRQAAPEDLKDPKAVFAELHSAMADRSTTIPDCYSGIAEVIDLAVLKDRCPAGFRGFAGLVEEL